MFSRVVKFLNYWYFRYLLVTEMYMVEKWERIMMHTVFFVMLSLIYLFNSTVLLGLASWVLQMTRGDPVPQDDSLIPNYPQSQPGY